MVQLKQLLLDPALNKEFNRLKAELEETQKELKHVQVGGVNRELHVMRLGLGWGMGALLLFIHPHVELTLAECTNASCGVLRVVSATPCFVLAAAL